MNLRSSLALPLPMLSWLLLLAQSATAQATPTLAEVCADFGCDSDGIARAQAGKMVDLKSGDASERDLSVGFLFMVKRPPAEVARLFRQGSDFAVDGNVLAVHRLTAPARPPISRR